jgi:hypothetical protein
MACRRLSVSIYLIINTSSLCFDWPHASRYSLRNASADRCWPWAACNRKRASALDLLPYLASAQRFKLAAIAADCAAVSCCGVAGGTIYTCREWRWKERESAPCFWRQSEADSARKPQSCLSCLMVDGLSRHWLTRFKIGVESYRVDYREGLRVIIIIRVHIGLSCGESELKITVVSWTKRSQSYTTLQFYTTLSVEYTRVITVTLVTVTVRAASF